MAISAYLRHPVARYGLSLALVALFTGVVALVRLSADVGNASMLYLLAVMASALLFGSGPAIVTAMGSFAAFNFFFIEPRYTFTVADQDEWVALGLLLVTGVITGQLAAALRDRAREAERREKEAVALYDVVRLSRSRSWRERSPPWRSVCAQSSRSPPWSWRSTTTAECGGLDEGVIGHSDPVQVAVDGCRAVRHLHLYLRGVRLATSGAGLKQADLVVVEGNEAFAGFFGAHQLTL